MFKQVRAYHSGEKDSKERVWISSADLGFGKWRHIPRTPGPGIKVLQCWTQGNTGGSTGFRMEFMDQSVSWVASRFHHVLSGEGIVGWQRLLCRRSTLQRSTFDTVMTMQVYSDQRSALSVRTNVACKLHNNYLSKKILRRSGSWRTFLVPSHPSSTPRTSAYARSGEEEDRRSDKRERENCKTYIIGQQAWETNSIFSCLTSAAFFLLHSRPLIYHDSNIPQSAWTQYQCLLYLKLALRSSWGLS